MRILAGLFALALPLLAQNLPFTAEAMMRLSRISEPQLSPDGKMIAFTVETIDVEKNARPKQIYIMPVSGGTPQRITTQGTSNQRPRWTPDSKQILYVSNQSGASQVWMMNPDGSGSKQVTTISTEASDVTVSPDGKRIVFTSDVYPDCADDACNRTKLDAENASKMKARSYTSLLYRHWNAFMGKRRKHLMTVPMEGGAAKDLTPGNYDVPTFQLGGPDDFAISPDGKEVAYVADLDPNPALSTNTDIFVVPITGGDAKKVSNSLGGDRSPVYSPDGKYLAYRSQQRAGFESDRWRLALLDRATGSVNYINEGLDRNVETVVFSPDSTRIFYVVEDRGRSNVQMMPTAGGSSRVVITGASHIDDVQLSPDTKTMIYTEQTGARPTEIFRAQSAGGAAVPLTHLNDAVLSEYTLTPLEEFWVESGGTRIHSFLVKPPNFQAGRKYPVLVMLHGGPQGAWGESWSYRWNQQVFAAAGFVVIMPNPRGSTGYGQKFTDEVSTDWGGKPYDDIMAVVEHVASLPYVDSERMAAAGGSYGGYMADWLLGHTTRFKALVSHAGVYDLRSMAGETEELWFVRWEFQGFPWENPEMFAKFSPSSYVTDFHTPTLVTHGELDYRVPVGQGMQLFTALQIQKVPSKLVLFPDEGHWVLKPQNSLYWYKNVLDWIEEWTRPKPVATQ